MVVTVLDILSDMKSECEFKGTDFGSDLVSLYQNVRVKIAETYKEFGPVSLTELGDDLIIATEKKDIKLGYDRIKQKVKDIRQDYRTAVTEE